MYIDEIPSGQEITLNVSVNGTILTFHTIIRDSFSKRHSITADVVMHDEHPVAFRGTKVSVDVMYDKNNDKPLLFRNVVTHLIRDAEGKYIYVFTTPAQGTPINRRENFRCFVGIPCSLQCNSNKQTYDVTIRDISATGFSIVSPQDLGLSQNQLVHTVLNDYLPTTAQNFSFQLYGLMVRTQELENGKILYGCRLNNQINGLDKYIMTKERVRLKSTNGGNL